MRGWSSHSIPASRASGARRDSIQFGVDQPALVLDGVSAAEERMLAALAAGSRADGPATGRATARRAATRRSTQLLDRLAPGARRRSDGSRRRVRLAVVARRRRPDGGRPRTRSLRDAGMTVRSGLELVGRGRRPAGCRRDRRVATPSSRQRHGRWLRRDVPHLPSCSATPACTVGPFVRPGRGPCLRCLDLHRTDADPAWPAMATQLHARDAAAARPRSSRPRPRRGRPRGCCAGASGTRSAASA